MISKDIKDLYLYHFSKNKDKMFFEFELATPKNNFILKYAQIDSKIFRNIKLISDFRYVYGL